MSRGPGKLPLPSLPSLLMRLENILPRISEVWMMMRIVLWMNVYTDEALNQDVDTDNDHEEDVIEYRR